MAPPSEQAPISKASPTAFPSSRDLNAAATTEDLRAPQAS